MRRIAYAVIKNGSLQYTFSKWHDSLEEATKEAERLCKQEKKTFLVLKVVGYTEIEEVPVKTVSFDL